MLLLTPYEDVLNREIVLTRVLDAKKELVFAAFTTQQALEAWFGPAGFTTKTFEFDFKVGGRWRFEFKGPDGTAYGNRIEYTEISPPDRIAFYHGEDKDDDPGKFFVTITFDEQQNQKTVLSLRQLHPTAEQRKAVIGFGAVEFGMQTMDKLAAYLARAS
ncbi:MAG: SRPBCC family protein [Turneriella sp.]|nr:SRPBCC family protein [Turneriella sp.]